MPSPKPQKIDLNGDYPCPCRCRGRLIPITLTDAFGCNCCQQIFVVDQTGYVLEKLSAHYPYKQTWCWKGEQWQRAYPSLRAYYLPLSLASILLLLVIWLPFALGLDDTYIIFCAMVALVLAMLPALMVWLAYRR